MASPKIRATVAIAIVVAPLVILAIACNRRPEQQFLTQFFRAARGRDNTTLGMMAAVAFDPREQGSVESFEITNVTPESRKPLDFKPLIDAERKAKADEEEFRNKKIEYQQANLPALETIVKLERDPKAKMTPDQLKMKAEWDKWRADTAMHTKAVAAATMAVRNSIGVAEASLTQPGQPPLKADQFSGELVSKDVTVDADVRMPDGQTTKKTLTLTLQKVVGAMNGQQRDGRWIISNIQGA